MLLLLLSPEGVQNGLRVGMIYRIPAATIGNDGVPLALGCELDKGEEFFIGHAEIARGFVRAVGGESKRAARLGAALGRTCGNQGRYTDEIFRIMPISSERVKYFMALGIWRASTSAGSV